MDLKDKKATVLSVFCSLVVGAAGQCNPVECARTVYDIADPAEYYASTVNLAGSALKAELNTIISGHNDYSYTCVWSALGEIYADSNDPDRVIAYYTKRSIALLDRDCGSTNPDLDNAWNREHVWASSHGFSSRSQFAYTDIYHLVPADRSVNSDRSDKDFDIGGTSHSECVGCFEQSGTFEPPDEVKGEIARKLFYMDTRYEGNDDTGTPDLTLVNRETDAGSPELGVLSTLLQWHENFPVSEEERHRNDKIQQWQGNRNPFIDRPEFVEFIWGSPPDFESTTSTHISTHAPSSTHTSTSHATSTSISTSTSASTSTASSSHTASPTSASESGSSSVWINEFHYDNSGADIDEFIEIGCNKYVNLTGYSIVLYNGANGAQYNTVVLMGVCSPSDNFLVQSYPANGIQNGAADGIALVDSAGTVIQFISYEGTLTAINGPAAGQESVDIGVAESSSTNVGESLQLVGQGCLVDDFVWQYAQQSSQGSVNNGQEIILHTECLENDTSTPIPRDSSVWVNEIHYDNGGSDIDEFIEIGCNGYVNLTDYSIVLYNGANGANYNTVVLWGVCSPSNVQSYPANGIQNGAADGIALIDSAGTVIQFISYEGTLTAIDGPAADQQSVDIGEAESSSTNVGESLQLVGQGCLVNDFVWQYAQQSSQGSVNVGQEILGKEC